MALSVRMRKVEMLNPAMMPIPLAVFDVRDHRIGYGANYYDRAIVRLQDKNIDPRLSASPSTAKKLNTCPTRTTTSSYQKS